MGESRTMLDLSQFSTPAGAVASVQRDRPFDDTARPVLESYVARQGEWNNLLWLFFGSAVSRARGLYEGIARELASTNPHATFPLIRQFAETVALVYYVSDHPNYVDALTDRPRNRKPGVPRRKSPQALVNYMDNHHSTQFGHVYAELCEATHFGSVAMWTSHRYDDESETASWSSAPAWRSDQQLYIACAQTLELSAAMDQGLTRLGRVVVESA